MSPEELAEARAWAENAEPYPVKRGFLTLLDEIDRQRDHIKALENRANLLAGLAAHDPDLQGQHRAAVFILTGEWPADPDPVKSDSTEGTKS